MKMSAVVPSFHVGSPVQYFFSRMSAGFRSFFSSGQWSKLGLRGATRGERRRSCRRRRRATGHSLAVAVPVAGLAPRRAAVREPEAGLCGGEVMFPSGGWVRHVFHWRRAESQTAYATTEIAKKLKRAAATAAAAAAAAGASRAAGGDTHARCCRGWCRSCSGSCTARSCRSSGACRRTWKDPRSKL